MTKRAWLVSPRSTTSRYAGPWYTRHGTSPAAACPGPLPMCMAMPNVVALPPIWSGPTAMFSQAGCLRKRCANSTWCRSPQRQTDGSLPRVCLTKLTTARISVQIVLCNKSWCSAQGDPFLVNVAMSNRFNPGAAAGSSWIILSCSASLIKRRGQYLSKNG